VLEEHGVELLFTKVAIKPGAPLVFGRRDRTLVFGLPGNPVSAQVTFDVFVRAALLRMQGARVVSRPRVEVELLGPLKNRSGRQAHVPARVRFEDGRLVARPVRSMGSGDMVAHSRANALVALDAERVRAETGETAPAVLLDGFLEDDGAPI
jgi:molybdopterin molybdotransferase